MSIVVGRGPADQPNVALSFHTNILSVTQLTMRISKPYLSTRATVYMDETIKNDSFVRVGDFILLKTISSQAVSIATRHSVLS